MGSKNRILIIYPVDFEDKSNKGVFDKMVGQGLAFEEMSYHPNYAYLLGNKCILQQDKNISNYATSMSKGWSKYMSLFKGLTKHTKAIKYQIIYIRHLLFTTPLYKFLSLVNSPSTKIVYEFPTLPYVHEWNIGWRRGLLSIDKRNKEKCLKLVSLIVHFGGFTGNQKSIEITNGIRLPKRPIPSLRKESSIIRMVAVGKWAYWHGLDRVIRGLALSHENIFLDIVGDGPSSANLMNLANSLKLNSHITFHGYKHGHELENLLFSADIGLGTLGIHRKNVKFDSSLKHRLYCAFGLPFIHSSIDPDFNDNFEFNIKAEISDNPLNIGSILDRFEEIQKISGYPQKIRSYALQNLSWHKKITDVLNEL